jgi:crotonobetaine/carnitine-CoA ligase
LNFKTSSVYSEEARLSCEALEAPSNVNLLVDRSVAQNGDKVLWTFIESGQVTTYREFYARLAQTANYLKSKGVRHGSHVAVMLGNTPDFFYFWLAFARLGAVMVPVNVRYTSEEVVFVLNDSNSSFLVTDEHGFEIFNSVAGKIPRVQTANLLVVGTHGRGQETTLAINGCSSVMPDSCVKSGDLLNIQYTSGTTGFPKGCMLSHHYWVEGAVVAVALWPERPQKILSDSPFFYIDPQWELLTAMFAGGELVAAPRPSLTKFMSYIRDYRIDYCSLWEALALKEPSIDDQSETLRYSWTFGLNPAEHALVEKRFGLKAREMYAMTEIG